MTETLDVIAKRYSCRAFKPDPLPEESIRAVARAAVQSPSGMNRQAWRVIVVKNKALIDEMDAAGMEKLASWEDKSAHNRMMERGGRLFYGAHVMLVIALDEKQPSLIDCGILCQTVSLAAASLGLGSLICGMARLALDDGPEAGGFKRRLCFPEGYVFGCSVLLGYADTVKAPHEPDMEKIIVVE